MDFWIRKKHSQLLMQCEQGAIFNSVHVFFYANS